MTAPSEEPSRSVVAHAWRIWAKALGEKSGSTDSEADTIALIRTGIILCYVLTNLAILAGIIRHW